jgi:hypothetical protein
MKVLAHAGAIAGQTPEPSCFSQGPNGDSQDNWTLDYRMKRVGWQWLIDYAGPHNGSTHTSG